MKKMEFFRRCVSFCLACLVLASVAGPATVYADSLEYDRILPAACDHFGEMEGWTFGESLEMTVYVFVREKDPYQEMKSFAQAQEDYGLVLKSDTKTSEGDRQMELSRDGETCVAILWDQNTGLLIVGYGEDIATLSEQKDKTVLYLGREKYPQSEINDFVKHCSKVLGTTAEKASKTANGNRIQKLTRNGETVLTLYWYDASQILTITSDDGSALEKLGIRLDKPEQKQDETVDKYSRYLPDLASFLDTKYTQDVWGYTHYVTCLINKENEKAVMDAFRALLLEPRYQLKERDTWSGTESGKKCTYYSFEYTGSNEEVDWIRTTSGRSYHVRVARMDYSSTQTAIVFSSHPEFLLKDSGVTWDGQSTGGNDPDDIVTPESDYVNHTGIYILGIMEDCFGTPRKEDYNAERYETNYYFKYSSYPESKFKSLRGKMESLGLKCRQSSYSSDGGSKEIVVKAEGGSCLKAIWRAKSEELQVTIKWEYVKKAGIFDSADVPAEPAPAPDPDPEPGKIDCPDCTDGRCNTCGGDGELDGFIAAIKGKQDDVKTCKDCHSGRCKTCYGFGKING